MRESKSTRRLCCSGWLHWWAYPGPDKGSTCHRLRRGDRRLELHAHALRVYQEMITERDQEVWLERVQELNDIRRYLMIEGESAAECVMEQNQRIY